MSLPDGYTVRPSSLDDLDAVHRLFLACSLAEHGSPDFSREELLSWWRDEGFELANNSLVVLTPDEIVAGYTDVSREPTGRLAFNGRVQPPHTGLGIGGFLVAWADDRARTMIATAPVPGGAALQQWVPVANAAARALLTSHGFRPVRRFWRMRIELNAPPEPPAWPQGITMRTFVPGADEAATHEAVQDAFHDHWRRPYLPLDRWVRREVEREDFDPSLWFLAMEGDEIAGVAHGRMDGAMGWIDELGVRPAWRRRGVARALLQTVFATFYQRGVHAVGLGVDAQSETGAPRLYEKAGMRLYREWAIYEKTLGPS